MHDLGRTLIVVGLLIAVLGAFLYLGQKVPWLGNLPGDIDIRTQRFRFYFPLVTCLLISAVLSLVLYLFHLWRR